MEVINCCSLNDVSTLTDIKICICAWKFDIPLPPRWAILNAGRWWCLSRIVSSPWLQLHACVLCCLYAKQSTISFNKPARTIWGQLCKASLIHKRLHVTNTLEQNCARKWHLLMNCYCFSFLQESRMAVMGITRDIWQSGMGQNRRDYVHVLWSTEIMATYFNFRVITSITISWKERLVNGIIF
jgi:hypothetical protein